MSARSSKGVLRCKHDGTLLDLHSDTERGKLLYCPKCFKMYLYIGPESVDVNVGTNREDIRHMAEALYLTELE